MVAMERVVEGLRFFIDNNSEKDQWQGVNHYLVIQRVNCEGQPQDCNYEEINYGYIVKKFLRALIMK